MTPEGPEISGRDGRRWMLSNPEAVVAAFRDNGADLPIDFEHATQVKGERGEAAPAIGWIKDLEVRNRAIWARVEWTEAGNAAITARQYRYVSPVFTFKKAAGDILAMVSAGLTNQPNLKLAALNRSGAPKETVVNKEILKALGLNEDAGEADVLRAINKIKQDEQTALNRARHPDSAEFVPRADYDLALNRIGDFEAAEQSRKDAEIAAAVDAAVERGKIAPASKDYHMAACRQEGGLEAFNKMIGSAPEIAPKSGLDQKSPGKTKPALSGEEQAMCRALGMDEEDFIKAKAEQE